MHLLYITFGKEISNHVQAAFSICTFLTQQEWVSSINVLTDEPSYYQHLHSNVNVMELDNDTLRSWRGPHDFFWRIKIKGMALLCKKYNGEPVMYLDTDTFLYRPPMNMIASLSAGKAVMHACEGPLAVAASKTEKRMWNQVKGRSFGKLVIASTQHMWNAGVVATPNTANQADIELALQICDDMCAAGVTRRLIEQFSLSVALDKTYSLTAASECVAHYWSHKDAWNVFISRFFMQAYLQRWSLPQIINAIQELDFSRLPILFIQRNTGLRLHRTINRLFHARQIKYVSNGLKDSKAPPGHSK